MSPPNVVPPAGSRLLLELADIEGLRDLARLGCATELLGAARRALDITVAYLGERQQFGVPIGSFQALQHRAASLHGELELAAACVAEG